MARTTDVAAPCSGVFMKASSPAASIRAHSARWASGTWRCRAVQMPPGIRALAVMPSPAQRRVASTANSTFAVFDWP